MSADLAADDPLAGQPRPLDNTAATVRLIDRFPRRVMTLPLFVLAAEGEHQPWHVTVTVTPVDQAALDALQPSVAQLCAAAQHALGLAAIGSVIEPAYGTVLVRTADEPQQRLVGAGALWWVANAPPPLLRAFEERLAAEVERRRRGGPMQIAVGPDRVGAFHRWACIPQ